MHAQLMGATGDGFEREPSEFHDVTFRFIELYGVVRTCAVCSLPPCGGGLGRGVHTGGVVVTHPPPPPPPPHGGGGGGGGPHGRCCCDSHPPPTPPRKGEGRSMSVPAPSSG